MEEKENIFNLPTRVERFSDVPELTDDDSSLSALDLNALPDARHSVSLIHVSGKSSSIGSFLEHCFSPEEQEVQTSGATPNDKDQFRLSEVPFLEGIKSSFAGGADDMNDTEFDFNPDELDLDILINEEDCDLNNTLTQQGGSQEVHSTNESNNDKEEKNATTFDFLKGLGLAGSPKKSLSSTYFKSQMSLSEQTEEGSLAASHLDSCYFAPASQLPTPLHEDNGSIDYENQSEFDQNQMKYTLNEDFGEDVGDGKSVPHSSTLKGAFDDWVCEQPLNFSTQEFQDDSALQKKLFGNEQFASADDAAEMLDKEEKMFEKENHLLLNENFVASSDGSDLRDFSIYRTSGITLHSEADESGKISIGTYIAKRSDKLGKLEGTTVTERPSFGMKVRTPSPQKPCTLVGSTNLTTIQDEASSVSKSDSEVGDEASTSVDLSAMKFDDTIDPSMMNSLSKAINDMSASMNNEELARFIIALSNRKLELQKQSKSEPHQSRRADQASVIASIGDVDGTVKCDSAVLESDETDDEINSTLKKTDEDLNALHTVNTLASASNLSVSNQVSPASSSMNDRLDDEDELSPLPDSTFSPCSTDCKVLSSTRTNLSLTRGSLSRESIEKLHHQLRVRGEKPGRILSRNRVTALPDVVSDQPSPSRIVTSSKGAGDKLTEEKKLSFAAPPESSSFTEASDLKPENNTFARLSSAFHEMTPSDTYDELATIAESQFNTGQIADQVFQEIKEDEKADESRGCTSEPVSLRDELSSCASDLPAASITETSENNFTRSSCSSAASDVDSSTVGAISNSYPPSTRPPTTRSYSHYASSTNIGFGSYVSNHSTSDACVYPSGPSTHSIMSIVPQQLPTVNRSYAPGLYNASQSSAYPHPYQPVAIPSVYTLPTRAVFQDQSSTYYEEALPYVTVPGELVFDYVLCVGAPSKIPLPMQNQARRWVQVELRSLSVFINQKVAPLNYERYVSLKHKHVLGPHNKEDVEVSVIGHEPGRYKITLEVISNLISAEESRSVSQRCSVSKVILIADVSSPSLCLFGTYEPPPDSKQSIVIDFGEVVLGSDKSLPLRILNRSKVEIPVRLICVTSTQDRSSFTLSLSSSSREHDQSNLGSLAILRTVLAVSDRPFTVWVHFHSSNRQHPAEVGPVKVEGRIEAVLDVALSDSNVATSKVETLLDTVGLSALVGVGKLHAPRSQQLVTFTAAKGASDVKSFPVKNAGNICVQVSFSFDSKTDLFSLKPNSAVLPPGGDVQLTVEFQPALTAACPLDQPISNLILMNIIPSGPQFEMQLTGIVKSETSQLSSPTSLSSPVLLTNKFRLRWGGVLIGAAKKQKLMLRAGDSSKAVKLRCSIKGDVASSFQLVSTCGELEELVKNCNLAVMPHQDLAVLVSFAPSRKKLVHAKLEIKTPIDELPTTKYSIPLSGYGGACEVHVEDLDESDQSHSPLHNEYTPQCYVMSCDGKTAKLKVSNCGSRMAFVKIMACSDSGLKHISSSVVCIPSQFTLDERQSRVIDVTFTTPGSESVYLSIWHGDELARLLMRKALSAHPSQVSSLIPRCVPASHAYIRSLSFDGIFDEEDLYSEENLDEMEPHNYDVQLFYANIRLTLVEVKCATLSSPESLSNSTTSNLSCQDLPVKDVQLDTKALDVKVQPAVITPSAQSSFALNWSLSPTHITITMPPPAGPNAPLAEPIRVKIKNHSLASLIYDVVWPGHYLTITPQRGRVEPESVAILLVSANPSLTSNLLPWCGQALVLATGGGSGSTDNSRTIFLQIKESKVPPGVSSEVDSHVSEDTASEDSPSSSSALVLRVIRNPIEFEDVAIGNSSKSHLEFVNLNKTSIKWLLSAVAPSYVKSACSANPGSIFRSTYASFIFSHKSGLLEAGARVHIPVTFNPMNVGMYSQHWEIEYHDASDVAALTLQSEKVQLQGKGINPQHSVENITRKSNEARNDIYVSESCFWFPDTSLGRTSIIKIPIKNRGKNPHTVNFVNLQPPFYITHQSHSIRSMSCAKLPVNFKPSQLGSFSDSLVIKTSDSDAALHITVKAKAV